jgi:hypothetical protein
VVGDLDELRNVVVPLLGELDDLVNPLVALLLVLLRRQAVANLLGLVHLRSLLNSQVDDAGLETEGLEKAARLQLEFTRSDWGCHGGLGLGSIRSRGRLLSKGGLLLPELPVGTSATALGLEGTVGLEVVGRVLVAVTLAMSVSVTSNALAVSVAVSMTVAVTMTVAMVAGCATLTGHGSARDGGRGSLDGTGCIGLNGGCTGVLAGGELLVVYVKEVAFGELDVVEVVTFNEFGIVVEVAFSEVDVTVRGGEGSDGNRSGEGGEESKGGLGVHVDYIYVGDLSDEKSIGKGTGPVKSMNLR